MLADLIKNDKVMDDELLNNWNSVIDTLYTKHISKTTKVEGNLGHKYRGDLYGLFLELELPKEFIYPHMRVNGYSDSSDYDGSQLTFFVLDDSALRTYYQMFTRKK
jgi:hypothetical protein